MKTVRAEELSTVSMVAGNEKRYSAVIDDGVLKEWVGFGWIDLRDATDEDRENYPTVVRDDD